MNRGNLYRIYKPTSRDPKRFRVFVVVSRQVTVDSNFSTVICAPIYTNCSGLETQVEVDIDFIGQLSKQKLSELNRALKIALAVDD